MSKEKAKQKLNERYSDIDSRTSILAKKSFHKPLFISGITVIAIVGFSVAATFLSGHSDKPNSKDASSYNLVVTPNDSGKQTSQNASKAATGTYDVCMNSTWNFADAKSASSNAYVENITSNTNTVMFVVKRDDTGDTIYESPYIPVGSSLRNIKLNNEDLSKGTYPCTLTYHLVDDDRNDISTLNISINVVIEDD